jgi:hypothetical protein
MGRQMQMTTRMELIQAVRERYLKAAKDAKQVILDEFVATTGYHRKHAIRLLGRPRPGKPTDRRHKRVYEAAVEQALIVLWEASDRLCGKRLKSLLPILIDAMTRQGHLALDAEVQRLLLAVSPATIDRLLKPTREATRTKPRRSRINTAIRKAIPVRTFADWKDPVPGYCEADFVAHCGGNMGGRFVHSFVFTDVASGWTECIPVLVREQSVVVEAIGKVRLLFPIPLRGLDTDNDSAFINETLIEYCATTNLEFTRSRAYRKNDQAWIEQKNGAIVRRLVGYGRLEGTAGAATLSRLYAASRLYVNYFQPSFKLQSKSREGAKLIKKYDVPQTPCQRLLASSRVDEQIKTRLQQEFAQLDPVRLLEEIRSAQQALANLVMGKSLDPETVAGEDALKAFMQSLATAWQAGEVRPTHQRKAKGPRAWRTRKDPFDQVWPELETWLTREPDLSAKDLFLRLQKRYPQMFPDSQLRTLQRRVKSWRVTAAHQLIFATPNNQMMTGAAVEKNATITLQ